MEKTDQQLIDWVKRQILEKYGEDVALLIGRVGACKIPSDEQEMAFDFFVPSNERGHRLAKTFVIGEMGYDLFPISWNRIQDIVDLNEPRMIFAFMRGEIIWSKKEEDSIRYLKLKEQLKENLGDKKLVYYKALELLSDAMEIYQAMMFEEDVCAVRKAVGGIACYLMSGIAMLNEMYLANGYENLIAEMKQLKKLPMGFEQIYEKSIYANKIDDIRAYTHQLLRMTRDFFLAFKPLEEKALVADKLDYKDLAGWYYEARYTFRKIEYYVKTASYENCFLMGCYLQIEFDAITEEFLLDQMDLLSAFDKMDLSGFAKRAKRLEAYIVSILKEHHVLDDVYLDADDFISQNV